MDGYEIGLAGLDELDDVEPLWRSLHAHHHSLAQMPLVADHDVSWQRRRDWYRGMLAGGDAFMLVARDGGRPVGYAFVEIRPGPDDTWPIGDRMAELMSLSVAPDERGRGLGSALMDAVDAELERRGVTDLEVAVLAGNERALRFYGRRGLRLGELLLFRFGRERAEGG
jgi:ribosomal protein S18 acetylase RimI-like enzyme